MIIIPPAGIMPTCRICKSAEWHCDCGCVCGEDPEQCHCHSNGKCICADLEEER